MAKRIKRAEKGAESIIKEIEKHLKKLDDDIRERNLERGRYHYKEIDRSLLPSLEIKLRVLGENKEIIKVYRKKLDKLKEELNL